MSIDLRRAASAGASSSSSNGSSSNMASLGATSTSARQMKLDHVSPNPSNPLVTIHRALSAEETLAQAALKSAEGGLDPRGLPSKGGKLTDLNAPTPLKPSLPMPERLQNPDIWQNLAQPQHPLYRTSNHSYGARPPAREEMGHCYYGNAHKFTSTFSGGMWTNAGLNTAITRSKVNGAQDEFGYN